MSNYKNWAVFVDRDGTINEEVNYLSNPNQLKLIPGAAEAIKLLNRQQIPVIVVTNQSGIARGYLTELILLEIHITLSQILRNSGACIDDFYYCPHHENAAIDKYKLECNCRKPQPGLLKKAAEKWNLDLNSCYLIGDKLSDIVAGKQVGCKTILVKTGYGHAEAINVTDFNCPDRIEEDILIATKSLLSMWI